MIAALLGRLPGRSLPAGAAVDCVQCGRPGLDPIRVRFHAVRCCCPSCGAVFTLARAAPGRPADIDPRTDPLTEVMPAAMARWLRREHSRDDLGVPTERATLVRWYAGYDRTAETGPDGATRPPDLTRVLGALQSCCFDPERALARLGDSPSTRERVAHAHRWLATSGRDSAWIVPPGGLVDADPAHAKALLEPGALTDGLDRDRVRALYAAVFGVAGGPSARGLVAQLSATRIRQAVRAYLADGSRPLREVVLAQLDGGADRR